MEKRLPLALFLCVLVYFWYSSTLMPRPGTDGAPGGETVSSVDGVTPADPSIPAASLDGFAATGPSVPSEPETPPVESEVLPFEGQGFSAGVDTRGASIAWLDLNEYTQEGGDSDPMRLLGAVDPTALGFAMRDSSDAYGLAQAVWELETREQTADGARLVFSHTTEDGLRFERELRSGTGRYTFDLDIRVTNTGERTGGSLNLVLSGPPGVLNDATAAFVAGPRAVAVIDERGSTEVETWGEGDLLDGDVRRVAPDQRLVCAGTMTNYFTSLVVPAEEHGYIVQPVPVLDRAALEAAVDEKNPGDDLARQRWRNELASDYRDGNASVLVSFARTRPAPGETVSYSFEIYAGPKDRDLAARPEYAYLDAVVAEAYGSMAWINRGMLVVLEAFHAVTGNWGVAIILLTVLVRALLFPLSRVQQSQMMAHGAKMQKLKPKLDELKAKYKNNQKKFNEAQIKLMQEHGVRPPLGGCLVMLLQFPIWIGLYQVLRSSIELRQASFFGWIDDLSQPDRMPLGVLGFDTINLLPILMAGAMVLSMRAQPKPADDAQAAQQKIMATIFPVMMLFLLYGYPAGLALYILTSSLLGIFEIQFIRKRWPVGGTTEPAPASS